MHPLFVAIAVFTIYPDISRVKLVRGNEYQNDNYYQQEIENFSPNNPPYGFFNKWYSGDKKERTLIRGIRPIVIHALNEWKRARLLSGKTDFPNGELYWGPNGLVKRSVDNLSSGKTKVIDHKQSPLISKVNENRNSQFNRNTNNENSDFSRIPQKYNNKLEYGKHLFEVIPTIILDSSDNNPNTYYYNKTTKKLSYPCRDYLNIDQHTEDTFKNFKSLRENLEKWTSVQKQAAHEKENFNEKERSATHHSHGHSHFHQHVHSHGHGSISNTNFHHGGAAFSSGHVNFQIPQTHIQAGAFLTNLRPQTQFVNSNFPTHQHQTTSFNSHFHNGFNSGFNNGFGNGGITQQQTSLNVGNSGFGFGQRPTTSNTNIQISQTGINNGISQTSFRQNENVQDYLRSPYLAQIPFHGRRVYFERNNKRSLPETKPIGNELHRKKRSLALVKLAVDPNAKLDFDQTSENAGDFVRKSFDDKHLPVSHIKDMTGSIRDTILSTARIVPQDVIIPSRYKIIDTHHHDVVQIPLSESSGTENRCDSNNNNFVGGINPAVFRQPPVIPGKVKESFRLKSLPEKRIGLSRGNVDKSKNFDPNTIYKTYQKIGEILRNTVQSGQQTLSHVNDALYSGRQIIHTTKTSVPKLMLPLNKIPALEKPGKKIQTKTLSDKVILLTPKGSGVEDIVGSSYGTHDNFVSAGNLFDSFGLTNPSQKANFVPSNSILRMQPNRKHLFLPNKSGKDVGDTLDALNDAEETVGASNLQDLLFKLKNKFGNTLTTEKENMVGVGTPEKSCVCNNNNNDKEELPNLTEGNLDGNVDEMVGSAFVLNNDLLKPFMGRINNKELEKLLNISHSDVGEDHSNRIRSKRETFEYQNDFSLRNKRGKSNGDHPIVGAINPSLFKEYFNEPLADIKEHHRDPFKEPADYSKQRTAGKKHRKLILKPFSMSRSRKLLQILGDQDSKVFEVVSASKDFD